MDIFFELIQISLGVRDKFSQYPTLKDWKNIYAEAQHQAVIGVTLDGLEKLPAIQRPPQEILLQWIGEVEIIKQSNRNQNRRVAELHNIFSSAGFKNCLLKGQGNAQMYPNPTCRMCGDIDLWVDGDRKEINRFVKSQFHGIHEGYKDISFIYKDTEIEVHYFPTYLNNLFYNRKLQKYIDENREKQFGNRKAICIEPEVYDICFPTDDFNIVYQMSHLYNHFFCQGIGLRHFIDYYYLLKQFNRASIVDFAHYGMEEFARGVMWIEKEILGIDDKYLITNPDKKTGGKILKEIMIYGNFNHKGNYGRSELYAKLSNTFRPFRYLLSFPAASIDRLFSLFRLQMYKIRQYY